MLSVTIPHNLAKLEQQIAALEQQIEIDTIDQDREIHKLTLKALKQARQDRAAGQDIVL